jgi:hypothetical protein
MPRTLRKSSDPKLRDVSLEEEKPALKAFLTKLRKQGWKKQEVDAAHGGWEWAFDTGFDRPEDDQDAARDLADWPVEESPRFWKQRGGKEGCADVVYTGICAARALQRTPDPSAVAEGIAEIKAATGRAP